MSDIVYKNFAFSTPFLSGYKQLCIPIMDNGGNPAWPELFPVEKIDQLRTIVGPRHFSAQMMLEFVAPDRVRLDPGAIHFYDTDFDARTAHIGDNKITGVAAYWDPSTGRRKSDGSVCVIIYRDDKTHRAFVHDVMYQVVDDAETHPLARQCDSVLDFLGKYNLHRIGIEVNGIGNALPEIMRDIAARRGVPVFVEKITNNKNKETRILDAIEPMLATGRLYAHVRVRQTPLISEMLGWTPVAYGGHDDGIDAVAGALQLTPAPIRPAGVLMRPFTANTNFTL